MAFWPFLIKTLTGLLKGVIGGLLKNRAKKGQKVDATQRAFTLAGFVIRPMELTSLLIAALVYGLAVCYTLQGWKMALPFVRTQELLVVVIYFSRSVVRFIYERTFKLTTQYKFWVGGGLLCLGSAYLGNTLGTVGYELESSKGPEDAARIVKMKTWLLVLALAMAVGFCIANRMAPAKLQVWAGHDVRNGARRNHADRADAGEEDLRLAERHLGASLRDRRPRVLHHESVSLIAPAQGPGWREPD